MERDLVAIGGMAFAAFGWAGFLAVRSVVRGPKWASQAYRSSQWIWMAALLVGSLISRSLAFTLGAGYVTLVVVLMARRVRRGLLTVLELGPFEPPLQAFRLSVLARSAINFLAAAFAVAGFGALLEDMAPGAFGIALAVSAVMLAFSLAVRVEHQRQTKIG